MRKAKLLAFGGAGKTTSKIGSRNVRGHSSPRHNKERKLKDGQQGENQVRERWRE